MVWSIRKTRSPMITKNAKLNEPGQGTAEPRRLKAKGHGSQRSHELLIFITYSILKVINVWVSITQNRL